MELHVSTSEDWRKWLELNHSISQGIWLIYYKKISGKPRVPYNEAVEEAICWGWIDGKIKRVNDDYYMQWFTPRRVRSRWSRLNISRAHKLISEGRMKPEGLAAFDLSRENPDRVYDTSSEFNLIIPEDLMDALKNNSLAFNNFQNFSPSCRKLYLFWLKDAKRAETRQGRIKKIIDRSEKNVKAGMM